MWRVFNAFGLEDSDLGDGSDVNLAGFIEAHGVLR